MESNARLLEHLNLIPEDFFQRQRLKRIQAWVGCVLLLLTFLLLSVLMQLQTKLASIEQELRKTELVVEKTEGLKRKAESLQFQLEQQVKREELLNASEIDYRESLDQIESSIFSGIRLNKITVTSADLAIDGWANKPSDSAVFLERLQKLFGDDLRLTGCYYQNDTRLYQFLIEGKIASR